MTNKSLAAEAAAYLDGLPGDLADAYPRAAHRGRLEQVGQAAKTLASLVGELDGEEHREADLEGRLLAAYREGGWKGTAPEHGVTHTHGAQDRLAAALLGNGGAA